MRASRKLNIASKLDVPLLIMYILLVASGLLTIYSSSYNPEFPNIYDLNEEYGRQLFWIGISLIAGLFIIITEGTLIVASAYQIYGLVCVLLLVVLAMPAINGAHSWFKIGSMSLQPSEFAKFGTALAVAKFLGSINVRIDSFRSKLITTCIVSLPAFLILIQPDPGTFLVFLSFVFVLYREGLSGNILLIGVFVALLTILTIFFNGSEVHFESFDFTVDAKYLFLGVLALIALMITWAIKVFLRPRERKRAFITLIAASVASITILVSTQWLYQNVLKQRHRNRIELVLGLKEDRKNEGYNTFQAMSAVGSGKFYGKGYMQGTMSNDLYNHVPEQNTDFIFCSVAEEWGFLGGLFVVGSFITLLFRIVMIAERQRSKFTRIFAYSAACILFMHFAINVAMVIGIAPVIGIPLPFFSYGGSSILGFSILIFILLRLDAERMAVFR